MQRRHFLEKAELMGAAMRLVDISIIVGSALLVYYFRKGWPMPSGYYPLLLLLVVFLTTNIFTLFSVYRAWRGRWLYRELTTLAAAWICVALCIGLITFLTKSGETFSRLWFGWTFVLSLLGMTAFRVSMRHYLRRLRSQGLNQKKVIIAGAGSLGRRACSSILRETWAGLEPVAFFDDQHRLIGQNHKGVPVIGDLDDIPAYIEAQRKSDDGPIDQVWIALPLDANEKIQQLQDTLGDTASNVYFIPDVFTFALANYSVDEVVGLPIMNMSASPMNGGAGVVKRAEDVVVSALMIAILSPVLLVIALIVKLESPGPVIFKQRRYGQDGKEIFVWKFRSMSCTEDGAQVTQAQRGDSRITRVGYWLRKLSLDELPQLFNVLQGTMSLVGPRPHAVAHNEFYRTKVSGYMGRHKIRPGITGWAQVNGCRGETARIGDMEERIRYDLEYIRNWSVPLDLRILFRTVGTVMNYKNTY